MNRPSRPAAISAAFVTTKAAVCFLAFFIAVVRSAVPGAGAGPKQDIAIRWVSGITNHRSVTVEVTGLSDATLEELRRAELSPDQWRRLFSIHAEQGSIQADIGLPPMLGVYRVDSSALRFVPQFPLEPGVQYRGVFWPGRLPGGVEVKAGVVTAQFQLPAGLSRPATVVSHIHPGAEVLPENLLKFYVHFSAAMSRGRIYDHIHLRDAEGGEVELPFLEIDEELWNPGMTRLTLFIDPGRIKRGVRPLEEIGPALEEGRRYALVIDRNWKDAAGMALQASFEKRFLVGPPDRDPPDPARWELQTPKAGSTETLAVLFPDPMDHALAQRMIRVTDSSGRLVPGIVSLEDQERRWKFRPESNWRSGLHRLVVQTDIEDLAGNNIGKPFEVDLVETGQRRLTRTSVSRSFEIR